MAKRLWDLLGEQGDVEAMRLHLGGKQFDQRVSATEDTVEMQWTDYHYGDESRPE